jgi:hypothetical protein
MRCVIIFAVMLGSFDATSSRAQTPTSFGLGTLSCRDYLGYRARRDPKSTEATQDSIVWVQGFVAAMATLSKNIRIGLSRVDGTGTTAWVDDFCRTHPGEDLAAAAFRFAVSLGDINNFSEPH